MINLFSRAGLYKLNTQAIGKTSATVGMTTVAVAFFNVLKNPDFVAALLAGNRIAEVSLGVAFIVVLLAFAGALLGRSPAIPDDHSGTPVP